MAKNGHTEYSIQKLNDKIIECLKAFEKSPVLQNQIDGYDFNSMISNTIKKLETFRGQTVEYCSENNFQDFFNSANYELLIYQAYVSKFSKQNDVNESLKQCTILLNNIRSPHLFKKRDDILKQMDELDNFNGVKILERQNHINTIVMKTYAILELYRINCYDNYVYNLKMIGIGLLVSVFTCVFVKSFF